MGLKNFRILLISAVLATFLFSLASVAANPTGADPDGAWSGDAADQDLGLYFAWENAAAGYTGTSAGFGLSAGAALNPPTATASAEDPFTQSVTVSSGTFTPYASGNYHAGVDGLFYTLIDNRRADQTYQGDVNFYSGADRPDSGTLSWQMENSTHEFIPADFLAVFENDAFADGYINARTTSSKVFTVDDRFTLRIENAVNVTAPDSNSTNTFGATLDYTVTVNNNSSTYEQNFDLSATDTRGWTISFSPDNLLISAGGSATSTMSVTVQGGSDDITIFADSSLIKEDNTSCTANGPVGPQPVVDVSPDSQEGFPGDSLTYTVEVQNGGSVDDNYTLNITDNGGLTASLSGNTLVGLAPGDTRTVDLNVTIPSGASFGDHTVSVKVVSQENSQVSAENGCTVNVENPVSFNAWINPSQQSGYLRDNLSYSVNVKNTGGTVDNYDLDWSDNLDWGDNIWLEDNSLSVGGDNENSTVLNVHVPEGVEGGIEDNITVTVTSQENTSVSDSDSCIARAEIVRSVDVLISPFENSGSPGENLPYIVTVANTGNVSDNYLLENSDNLGWSLLLEDDLLSMPAGENREASLSVSVPEGVEGGIEDNITVVANSQGNSPVSDRATCTARSAASPEVTLTIAPENQGGSRGDNFSYTVEVLNSGNIPDNYNLSVTDDAGWDLSLSDNSVDNVLAGENRAVDLTVAIPEDARPDTTDNVTVAVNSREYESTTDNVTSIAHSLPINRSVEVSISPSEKEWMVGKSFSYTVTVKNTGDVPDNYNLSVTDDAGWDLSLSANSIEGVSPGEEKTVFLNVTIPSGTSPDTEDSITVTAISQTDQTADDSVSCIGRALILKSVKVEVSSGFKSGRPGEKITFEVVVTNDGQVDVNLKLTATATPGWSPIVEPSSLMLASGQSDNAKLTIPIPSNVSENETGSFEVRASLMEDSDITNADTCRVGVSGLSNREEISLPSLKTIIWIIIIGAVIAGVILAVRYLSWQAREG